MAYIKNLAKIREVKETAKLEEVNKLIRSGWMLIAVCKPDSSKPDIQFSLGL